MFECWEAGLELKRLVTRQEKQERSWLSPAQSGFKDQKLV